MEIGNSNVHCHCHVPAVLLENPGEIAVKSIQSLHITFCLSNLRKHNMLLCQKERERERGRVKIPEECSSRSQPRFSRAAELGN